MSDFSFVLTFREVIAEEAEKEFFNKFNNQIDPNLAKKLDLTKKITEIAGKHPNGLIYTISKIVKNVNNLKNNFIIFYFNFFIIFYLLYY